VTCAKFQLKTNFEFRRCESNNTAHRPLLVLTVDYYIKWAATHARSLPQPKDKDKNLAIVNRSLATFQTNLAATHLLPIPTV